MSANRLILMLFVLGGLLLPHAAAGEPVFSQAVVQDGICVHEIATDLQRGKTQLRVLLPTALQPGEKLPVIYLLPVEAGNESRYGNGLAEAKKHDLHNQKRVIFAAPTFSNLPWYADHPEVSDLQQESYFVRQIVPFVESEYPAQAAPSGRLLAGFSKSGWGAWTLLLRHPHLFGRAAAWDAPLMMDRLGKYGTTPIFGTEQNFQNYRLTALLRENAKSLGPARRLILTGYGNFRPDHEQAHRLLDELSIPHDYRDGPQRTHDWHSGWLPEAVSLLLDETKQ